MAPSQTQQMSAPRVVGIGEILWDVFPDGAKFGGAPANFAAHCCALGAKASMFSAVGKDELGTRARRELMERGIGIDHVPELIFPTGTVDVQLDPAGVASYEFAADCAWDHLEMTDCTLTLAAEADIVCFGSLGQRSRDSRMAIQDFVKATPTSALRIFDVNLRQDFYSAEVIHESLSVANVLKLNDEEVAVVTGRTEGTDVERLQNLREKYDLRFVALTRGENGAAIITAEHVIESRGIPTTVDDTVGAGDAFTAALSVGLFHGWPMEALIGKASELAAYVCSQKGATPALPVDLCEMFV
ncbi:MAG: fructokinase [Limisphaerales bacterium]|jgi:fructokinase